MENKLGTIKQWGFIAFLGLSLAACNGAKQSADNNLETVQDMPSKISEAPAAKELGCESESKKDDVN